MKIGIPRALIYFNYYPFWCGFFKGLGIEVVLSDRTTKQTMSNGSALVVSETCLPIKVYIGHILNLLDKGVDTIFVPSIQSIAHKIYNCSKIRALPDLVRNVIKRDFTLVEPTLDKSEKNQGLVQLLAETAAHFSITDEDLIRDAQKQGWQVFNNYQIMTRAGVHFEKALKYAINGSIVIPKDDRQFSASVAVLGHGYNLYDERVSMKIFDKLEGLGLKTYSSEQLTKEQLEEGMSTLGSSIYWANEYEMTGAAGHYLQNNKVDGVITVTAFGCGPDSIMIERITRNARRFDKPVLNLTLDEHTGEAGFVTRLEAFCDMLVRRKRLKNQLLPKEDMPEVIAATKKRANFENITIKSR